MDVPFGLGINQAKLTSIHPRISTPEPRHETNEDAADDYSTDQHA